MNVFQGVVSHALRRAGAHFLVVALVVSLFSVTEYAVGAQPVYPNNPNITLCHATESSTNPYNAQTIDASSIINLPNGHNEHNDGGLDDRGDIIPPFAYDFGAGEQQYPGKNWTTLFSNGLTGEAIYNNGGCNGVPPPPAVDLSVVKTVDVASPYEGGTVVYTLTIANAGPDVATSVVVTDALPSGLSFVSANPAPVSTSPLTWNIASLAKNGSAVITVTATVSNDQGGVSIKNTASVTNAVTDSNTENNSDDETITVRDVVVSVPGCTDVDAVNFKKDATTDDGSCLFPLTVTKVIAGDTEVYPSRFSFVVNGDVPVSFDPSGTNVLSVPNGTYTIFESMDNDYVATYANCTSVVINGAGATCTITNTPVPTETEYGTVKVWKQVVGKTVTDYSVYGFTLNGGTPVSFPSNLDYTYVQVPVGTYSLVETAAPDATVTYAEAAYKNTEAPAGDCIDMVVTKDIPAICRITNTYSSDNEDRDVTLTVTIEGNGSGTVDGGEEGGIACYTMVSGELVNDCTETYTPGTVVTLVATADEGSTFTGWSVGAGTCTGTTSPCTITLSADTAVTAVFTKDDSNSNGGGGGGGSRSGSKKPKDPTPPGQVLGESTSVIPEGAPDTGAGGTSHGMLGMIVSLLGMVVSGGLLRFAKHG